VNIVAICSDQCRARSVGYVGKDPVHTPNLDALASSGSAFTHHFCNHTMCGPSRKSMITGKYAHTRGWWCNQVPTQAGEPNLAALLKERGYQTVLAGKDHTFDQSMSMSITHRLAKSGPQPEAVPARDMPWQSFYRGKMAGPVSDSFVIDAVVDFIRTRLTTRKRTAAATV